MEYKLTILLVSVVYGVFALSYFINAVSGMMADVIIRGEHFSWRKFLTPIWLILLTAVVMAALVLVSVGVSYSIGLVSEIYGSGISEDIANIIASSISILTFLKLFYKGLVDSWQRIYTNIRCWFDISDSYTFAYNHDNAFNVLSDLAEENNAEMQTEFTDGGVG